MELIPAIDIRAGRCVRLTQGDYDRETVYDEDPAAVARRWADAGARRLHVVDLDGAREGRPVNTGAVDALVSSVGVPVQLGGGLRDIASVERYLERGVDRVVLGTAAVKDPAMLADALARFRDRIIVGVDARQGAVATEGWRETSEVRAADFVGQLAELGVARVVYTDILRDGTLTEPNFEALEALLESGRRAGSEMRVIASGGVSSIEHVRRLARTGIEGAIVGRALYTGDIDLAEALTAAQA